MINRILNPFSFNTLLAYLQSKITPLSQGYCFNQQFQCKSKLNNILDTQKSNPHWWV